MKALHFSCDQIPHTDMDHLFVGHVYAHGRCEAHFGYDLLCANERDYLRVRKLPPGRYHATAVGTTKQCWFYLWRATKTGHNNLLRGLLVFCDDKRANEYAQRKMNERSFFL